MAKLHIDLQEGFESDAVTVTVNGRQVLARGGMRTAKLTGFAASIEVDVDPGPVAIDVDVASGAVRDRIVLNVTSRTYLGVSKTGDTLSFIQRAEPFGYA